MNVTKLLSICIVASLSSLASAYSVLYSNQCQVVNVTVDGSSLSDNLDFGLPSTNVDIIIDREGYAIGFSNRYKQPIWAMYRLTRDELCGFHVKRTDDFRSDKLVFESASPADYRRTGYDKGHLVPAADMSFSTNTMHDSFYMSNMSPQAGPCNRGVWKDLESWVRTNACVEGSVFVITGPIFYTNVIHQMIGERKVVVPDAFYKVIYSESKDNPRMIGFIVGNSGSTNRIEYFVETVDEIEKQTCLDFFVLLDHQKQTMMESNSVFSSWTP